MVQQADYHADEVDDDAIAASEAAEATRLNDRLRPLKRLLHVRASTAETERLRGESWWAKGIAS
jgi:hypothetical protein